MATIETLAIIKANAGKSGYIGTLNGRSMSGSFFRKTKNEIMDIMYSASAPKHAMVIISPVLPVINAMMPTIILKMSAFAGVLNFEWTFPKAFGARSILPNS